MIDTTGWRVALTQKQLDLILKKSVEISEYNHELEETRFRILKSNLQVGSFHSNITIRCFDELETYIEFSIPKQFYGNNVLLLYPSQLDRALGGVWQSLVDHFGDFPHYMTWRLQRLDLCYSWRYASQASAEEALAVLQTFDYPRKSKYLYKESVMWRGKTSSIKFYLKHNEYSKHTRKLLIMLDRDPDKDLIYRLSIGVLRFEITFRKEALNDLFSKKQITYKDLLSQEFLERTLARYLNALTMNLDKSVMDDKEALKRLKTHYPRQKAIRLFTFYKLYNSPQLNHRQILKDHYNPSTIWRNKKDIANAKIGLPSDKKIPSFDLTIPSTRVVHPDPNSSSASGAA